MAVAWNANRLLHGLSNSVTSSERSSVTTLGKVIPIPFYPTAPLAAFTKCLSLWDCLDHFYANWFIFTSPPLDNSLHKSRDPGCLVQRSTFPEPRWLLGIQHMCNDFFFNKCATRNLRIKVISILASRMASVALLAQKNRTGHPLSMTKHS